MRARSLRFLATATACGGLALTAPLLGAGCQQTATTVPVRALERSGHVSFVCLGPRGPAGTFELPIEQCSAQQFSDINAYEYEDDAGVITSAVPHLYALVTQTTRGEVAVVDTSALTRNVLDANPVEPAANFLPIGALPTGIVSTPGGRATFVGVGEIGRAGIFALPSSQIRPGTADAAGGAGGAGGSGGSGGVGGAPPIPQLSSWPACALPTAPGDMLLVADPSGDRTCDGNESAFKDFLFAEGGVVLKLVVALPAFGGIVVIDAQKLLDRDPGSFEDCPVERWLPLEVDLTGFAGLPAPSTPPAGAACVFPTQPKPALAPPYTPRPEGMSYAQGTLYVADSAAPVIHVIDLATPCDPIERAPLLAYSAENPKRVVRSERISVAPAPTPDFKRYLYATDIEDGSIMAFDVGPTSTTRLPLSRPSSYTNPFQPPDRIKYPAPAADLLVVQHDIPEINPATGLAVAGVRCDPDPSLVTCTDTSQSCDIATKYQPNPPSYSTGASPAKLRGTFALAALTTGRLGVIDVDDLDAPCRGPVNPSIAAGCAEDKPSAGLKTTGESSCNAVRPNTRRSSYFVTWSDATGDHTPGLASYPLFFDGNGALIAFSSETLHMEAPAFASGAVLHVAGGDVALGSSSEEHELWVNVEDPQAHLADQEWYVTFEGALPGFTERLANLNVDSGSWRLEDPSSRFCDVGVLGEDAAREIHASTWKPLAVDPITKTVDTNSFTDVDWARLADYVQIAADLPDELDPVWRSENRQGVCQAWTQTECFKRFGSIDAPAAGRDLTIVEAYQDHVALRHRPLPLQLGGLTLADANAAVAASFAGADNLSDVQCCFPGALSFRVRTGSQWTVAGAQSGVQHNVVADPATGRCRPSCEPHGARLNVRAIEETNRLKDPSSAIFENPMFSFVLRGQPDRPSTTNPHRDRVFRFTTSGAFTEFLATLTTDPTQVLIQPQSMTFLSPTGEVVITDGSSNGILFVSLASGQFTRSFY